MIENSGTDCGFDFVLSYKQELSGDLIVILFKNHKIHTTGKLGDVKSPLIMPGPRIYNFY